MADPRLPPEVELLIFEHALQASIQDATNFFLVAHRVREWLLPKAFKVVVINEREYFPHWFTAQKLEKYGKYIRHLCITASSPRRVSCDDSLYPSGIISCCISFCPNLLTLAVWWGALSSRHDTSLLSKLPLTCISTDPAQLLTELAPSWPPSSVSPQSPAHIALKGIQPEPLFSGITHLEIIGVDAFVSRHLNQKLVLILHFPNLTHVALPVIGRPEISLTPDPVLFFLDHCRNLKALILIWSSGPIGLDHKGAEILPAEVRDDERLVVVRCLRLEDWKRGALGTGHNVWSFADMVLEQRRLVPDWRKTGQVRE